MNSDRTEHVLDPQQYTISPHLSLYIVLGSEEAPRMHSTGRFSLDKFLYSDNVSASVHMHASVIISRKVIWKSETKIIPLPIFPVV